MQIGMLAIGDVGKASPKCKYPLVERPVSRTLFFAAGRRIGSRYQLEAHVEFGVDSAEALQSAWRRQLRAALGRCCAANEHEHHR